MDQKTVIDNIINRYGDVINLKENPHLMMEILRNHAGGIRVEEGDAGVSVAGVGTPPPAPTPPGPDSSNIKSSLGNVVDNVEIMKEVLKLGKQVSQLTDHVKSVIK